MEQHLGVLEQGLWSAALAGAPYSAIIAQSSSTLSALVLLVVFAFPASVLLISVARLSQKGPLTTCGRLAPIAAGLGWALLWYALESLWSRSLLCAQSVWYLLASIRPRLGWALDCDAAHNTRHCQPLREANVTPSDDFHHYPDNFWPAQEYNRYAVRGDDPTAANLSMSWQPNDWFLGATSDGLALPSVRLFFAHLVFWALAMSLLYRFGRQIGPLATRLCLLTPAALYLAVAVCVFLATLVTPFDDDRTSQGRVDQLIIERYPLDYWTDMQGLYRALLASVDASSVFSGLVMFSASRVPTTRPVFVAATLIASVALPIVALSSIRHLCAVQVQRVQPAYRFYTSTDEVFAFDLAPTCLATLPFGSLWAVLFYAAHVLHVALGPTLALVHFLVGSIAERAAFLENREIDGLVHATCAGGPFFAGFLLLVPSGSKLVAFVRYVSQSAAVQLGFYSLLMFVYGFDTLERDLLAVQVASAPISTSATSLFALGPLSPTGPVISIGLYLIVPAVLFTKLLSVHDLLLGGHDLARHLDAAVQGLAGPTLARYALATLIYATPFVLILIGVAWAVQRVMLVGERDAGALVRPATEWQLNSDSTASVVLCGPESAAATASATHVRLFAALGFKGQRDVRGLLRWVLLAQPAWLAILIILFGINLFRSDGVSLFRLTSIAALTALHTLAAKDLYVLWRDFVDPERVRLYVACVTLEMGALNGYVLMFALNHREAAPDLSVELLAFANILLRGAELLIVMGVQSTLRIGASSAGDLGSVLPFPGRSSSAAFGRAGDGDEDDADSAVYCDAVYAPTATTANGSGADHRTEADTTGLGSSDLVLNVRRA